MTDTTDLRANLPLDADGVVTEHRAYRRNIAATR